MKQSFTNYILGEDANADIANLQAQIAQLQTRRAKQDKVLDDQIRRLQQNLAIRMKQNAATAAATPAAAPAPTV